MSSVFWVKFEFAFPTSSDVGVESPGIGWLDDSMVVKIEDEDSQVAVNMVRDYVLSKVDDRCSVDAPVNKVKGFRLKGVEFIIRIDLEQ